MAVAMTTGLATAETVNFDDMKTGAAPPVGPRRRLGGARRNGLSKKMIQRRASRMC